MDERSEKRLAELRELEPGWLDGTGQPVDDETARLAAAILDDVTLAPSIYPTPFGGIEIVWGQGMFELTLDPEGNHSAHIYGEYLDTHEENDE